MWKKHSLAQPRCEAPKTLIPSCSVKTGLTGRISCRCNSNARIEIGTRRDCQSFSAPPANCPSSSRSAPSHSRFWRKAEFHLRLVMGSRHLVRKSNTEEMRVCRDGCSEEASLKEHHCRHMLGHCL